MEWTKAKSAKKKKDCQRVCHAVAGRWGNDVTVYAQVRSKNGMVLRKKEGKRTMCKEPIEHNSPITRIPMSRKEQNKEKRHKEFYYWVQILSP